LPWSRYALRDFLPAIAGHPDDPALLFGGQSGLPLFKASVTTMSEIGTEQNPRQKPRNSTSRVRTPDRTTVLPADYGISPARFGRGVIGKHDRTLDPMVPPGSIVHIDTNERVIPTRRSWADAFHRPIFFLLTRDGYVCGWCELDEDSEWLTLIPHPQSPVSVKRWRYRTEIENVGRVVAVSVSLAE
jgi:hypothetical protein